MYLVASGNILMRDSHTCLLVEAILLHMLELTLKPKKHNY